MNNEKTKMISLEKENRMMGSMGSQLIFFKEDAVEALTDCSFTEKQIEKLLNNETIYIDEMMGFEFAYSLSEVTGFNVKRG